MFFVGRARGSPYPPLTPGLMPVVGLAAYWPRVLFVEVVVAFDGCTLCAAGWLSPTLK